MSDLLDKSLQLAKRACDLDRAENYDDAYEAYVNAVKHLQVVINWEKNPKIKATLHEHAKSYVNRAEQLDKLLQHKNTQKPAGPNGEPTAISDKNGKGTGAVDSDAKRLRDGLSNAIMQDKPNVKWSDISGLDQAKESLKEAVIMPMKFPHLFTGRRKPWRGILLYGPPGTGKSYLAKAVATEAASTFFSISSSDLVSKWMGESEKLVRALFELARENKPSIIFIDEIDALCGTRGEGESEASRRIKTEFLVQMDGVGRDASQILVLGATNIPWQLDSAIRRRFQKRIHIGLPDMPARKKMFQLSIGSTPARLSGADYQQLAVRSDGYSGSDISIVVQDALMQPIRVIQNATHYKKVTVLEDPAEAEEENDDQNQNPNGRLPAAAAAAVARGGNGGQKRKVVKYTPCSPGDAGAIEMTWETIEPDELLEPVLARADLLKALKATRASVSGTDVDQHNRWTQEYGTEG